MALEHEFVKWLDKMIEAHQELRAIFVPDDADNPMATNPGTSPVPEIQATSEPQSIDSFQSLKDALDSDKWPEAVNRNLICDPDSEKDKVERGRGILELMIEENLKGLKVLDYGCGEGHCAYLSADYETTMSVGYDIVEHPNWQNFEGKHNVNITTDFNTVSQNGPYDVIILFDVIDHVKNETPVQLLQRVKDLLAPNGQIYMRCHPFTSRHATHLYHDLNKAYAHLVFTKEELKQIVPDSRLEEDNIGVMRPIATYNQNIEDAGLNIVNRRDIKENPEEFFKIPKIAERIMQITGHEAFPEFQMSLQFIDYVLSK